MTFYIPTFKDITIKSENVLNSFEEEGSVGEVRKIEINKRILPFDIHARMQVPKPLLSIIVIPNTISMIVRSVMNEEWQSVKVSKCFDRIPIQTSFEYKNNRQFYPKTIFKSEITTMNHGMIFGVRSTIGYNKDIIDSLKKISSTTSNIVDFVMSFRVPHPLPYTSALFMFVIIIHMNIC